MVPVWGIVPASIAALILDFFAFTSACVVKAPPEFVLPAAWQLLLMEQTVVSIGCTSAENFGVIPVQEKVLVPPPVPPPPPVVVPLLLQAVNINTEKIINKEGNIVFFITEF